MSHNNPFPDESISTQPTEIFPPMEELRPRQPQGYAAPTVPQPVTETPQPLEPIEDYRNLGENRKKAMTVRFAIGKFNDYLFWFLWVLETVLAIRFLLKMIGAEPTNPFAAFLYALTNVPLLPFMNIVGSPSIHQPNQSFEFPTLIAMGIYFLLFYALRRFIRLLVSNPEEPVE